MESESASRERRAYWAAQMDEAYAFMQAVSAYPVEECGERVVSLPEAVAAAGVEVEFSTRPHVLGLPRLYLLREGLVPAFLRATRALNERGWVLRVEDAYRTVTMQKHQARQPYALDAVLDKVLWENEGQTPTVELLSRRLAALIAASPAVGTHLSGSAVDVSVLHRDTRAEVDRGAPYLEMSERTPMASPFVSPEAQRNREMITQLMRGHGFVTYPWEFWHYNAGDAYAHYLERTGQPARYGPVEVDPRTGAVTPIERPHEPLNSPAELALLLEQALSRRQEARPAGDAQ